MTRPRGRPARGEGVTRDAILSAALAILEEGGGLRLSMRSLAARLGVTPMSLYHHVADQAGLLRAVSDRVFGEVLTEIDAKADPVEEIRAIMIGYHAAVGRHPQLTLSIFTEPEAFAGVLRQITDRLTNLVEPLVPEPVLWRNILVDHAHGSGLAIVSAQRNPGQIATLLEQYEQALDRLLRTLPAA